MSKKKQPKLSIPALTVSIAEKLDLKDFVKYSDTFIETGTCAGCGIQRALDAGFKKAKSVEAEPSFFKQSSERFKRNTNVSIFYGLSVDHLANMIDEDKPLVILLDAHAAGKGTYGHDQLDNPDYSQHMNILYELYIILAHRKDHVIIIDDVNGLNPESQEYINQMLKANPNYSFQFMDFDIGGIYYTEKYLVAIPKQ